MTAEPSINLEGRRACWGLDGGERDIVVFGCDLVVLHKIVCMIFAIRVSIRIGDTLWPQVVSRGAS